MAENSSAFSWRIKEKAGGPMTVEFIGELDDKAELGELGRRLKGQVVFQLAKVRRISSGGVREWVNFVREMPQVSQLQLTECSPAFVHHFNVLSNFRGSGKVSSFFVPYTCTRCSSEEEKLIDTTAFFSSGQRLPSFACTKCGSSMELDDIPERYLAFLSER